MYMILLGMWVLLITNKVKMYLHAGTGYKYIYIYKKLNKRQSVIRLTLISTPLFNNDDLA